MTTAQVTKLLFGVLSEDVEHSALHPGDDLYNVQVTRLENNAFEVTMPNGEEFIVTVAHK